MDSQYATYQDSWHGQVFLATATYNITSIKLQLWRKNVSAVPNTMTVQIREVHPTTYVPTAVILASGTLSGNAISFTTPGLVYEFTLGSTCNVHYGYRYAIIFNCKDCNLPGANNYVNWVVDQAGSGYTNGGWTYSADGGTSWTALTTSKTFYFEVWAGEYVPPVIAPPTDKALIRRLVAAASNALFHET